MREPLPPGPVFFSGEGYIHLVIRDARGPFELVDNVDYCNHQQALEGLAEHYAGPLSVATGYVGL